MSVSLVICDDHSMVLAGIAHLLSLEPDLEVVDTCASGEEAIGAVERHHPDVLVIDYRLSGRNGLDTIAELREMDFEVPSIILSASIDDEALLDIMDVGVDGIVMKESASRRLADCIRHVSHGRRDIPEALLARADALHGRRGPVTGDLSRLTSRERQIAEKVARGRSNKLIAHDLDISESTVKTHLHHMFRKLGVSNRVQLTLLIKSSKTAESPRSPPVPFA